jgi:hypothetical protein
MPRFAPWFESLSVDRQHALAARYADDLAGAGLTVYHAAENRMAPIAPSLSPEVVDDDFLDGLVADARVLLTAATETAIWSLTEGKAHGDRLYHGFTPLEWECLRRDPQRLRRLATARVDSFRDEHGRARALEVNATIPAMQGYSDLIAHRWIRLIGEARGLSRPAVEELVARNGSNTADLAASIRAHYAAAGGAKASPSVLIVSRRGDSQLGELLYYERTFPSLGLPARHAWVDEVEVDAEGHARHEGERFDVVYRHIFARKVDPALPFARLLVDPGPTVLLNPVVSPIEVKGLLAFLSDPGHPARARFDERTQAVLDRILPWTRLLTPGPGTLDGGERVEDLVAWVAAHPAEVVVKRSWDYGGKGVFLGPDVGEEATRAKLAEWYGTPEWPAFVARAAAEPGGWIVQGLVPPKPVQHLIVEAGVPTWRELFVDLNAYANLGVAAVPTGGVCRASGSRIVNILGGGGLAPFVRRSVIEKLF